MSMILINAAINVIQNHATRTNPREQHGGGNNSPLGTVNVYKTPPPGTNWGVKDPHLQHIEIENFANVFLNCL